MSRLWPRAGPTPLPRTGRVVRRIDVTKFGRAICTLPAAPDAIADMQFYADLAAELAHERARERAADTLDAIARRDPTILDPRP